MAIALDSRRESTKHGPPPWTGSMDRVHGPPYHGPGPSTPYFYKLRLHHILRFDDLLRHVA